MALESDLYLYVGDLAEVDVSTAADYSGVDQTLVFEALSATTDTVVILNASLGTKTSSTTPFTPTAALVASARTLRYALRRDSDNAVLTFGKAYIQYAANQDS